MVTPRAGFSRGSHDCLKLFNHKNRKYSNHVILYLMHLLFESAHNVTGDVTTFTFRPEAPLMWTAGQSIKLEVPGPYGPLEHRFSISSAPHEGIVAITTRLSGSSY